MSNFFANKRLIILLLSLIVLVMMMGSTFRDRPNPSLPERLLIDSVSWVQGLIYKPAHAVAGFFEDIRSMYRIYEENKALKASLDRLAQVTSDRYRLEKENQRLKEMLNAKASLDEYELLFAQVVSRSPDQWNRTITINRGTRDGVKANMAVITPQGMIGRVQSASASFSIVELLTDIERGNYISAEIQGEEEAFGVIEEYNEKAGRLVMRKIPLRSKISEGDLVVTSRLGEVFPEGLLVGKVTDIFKGNYGLTQFAYIEPEADFMKLKEVFVVRYEPLQPSFDETEEGL